MTKTSEDDERPGSLTEAQAGILTYISTDIPGFSAIFKHRYSDFNVYEIDTEDQVVHLSDLSLPYEPKIINSTEIPSYSAVASEVNNLLSPLTWTRLTQLSIKYSDSSKASEKEVVTIDVSKENKEKRKEIHCLIKKYFSNLTAETIEGSSDEKEKNKKLISVSYQDAKELGNKSRGQWPTNRPKYLHFTLYKENMDSFTALSLLGKYCKGGRKSKGFSIGGTKDKRARTTQRVSICYTEARALKAASEAIKYNKIAVGNFDYKTTSLRLGDLAGNRFSLILRNLSGPLEYLQRSLESLSQKGFINYFGLQRFGNSSISTSQIGLACILGEWSKVVNLILEPRENDKPPLNEVRRIWSETQNAAKALKAFKGSYRGSIEGKILKALSESPRDFVGALGNLGRNQKSMYPHAYQSLLWNKIASKRILDYGLTVIPGDLVYGKERKSTELRFVTEETFKDYDIYDVVLPSPGHDVLLPQNPLKDFILKLLEADGLSLSDFSSKVTDFDVSGSYRSLLVRPKDLSWNLIKYNGQTEEDFLLSDLDVVKGKEKMMMSHDESGKLSALHLTFSLPPCSYATMALRELTKEETSKKTQSNLSSLYVHKATDKEKEPCEKKRKISVS